MKSVGRALLARLLTFPITAIATLLTARLVIGHAGASVYGVVMLIASIFALIPFADLGTGAAVINALSSGAGKRADQEMLLRTVFRWLLGSCCLLMAFGACGVGIWSWGRLLGVDSYAGFGVDLATTLSICIFGLSVPFSVGQRVLLGLSRNALALYLSASSGVFTLLVAWLLSQTAVASIFLAISMPMGILFSQVLSFLIALRVFRLRARDLLFGRGGRSREVFASAAPMAIMLVALPLALQGHRLIVARTLGPAALAEYTMAMQLYSPLWSFVAAASTSLWPLFASQRADRRRLRSTVRNATVLFTGAGCFSAIVVFLGGPVGAVWLSHGQISLSPLTVAAAGSMLLAQAVQQIPGMFLTTAAGLRSQSMWVVGMTLSALGLSVLMTRQVGPAGPFFSVAAAVAIWQLVPGFKRVHGVLRSSAKHRLVTSGADLVKKEEKLGAATKANYDPWGQQTGRSI